LRRFNLRRGLLSSAAVAVVVTVLAAIPSVASASSFGCTAAGSGLPWYGLNSAYTCIDVGGSGDTVWSVQGEWFGIGTLCNYRFRIRFRDIRGRLYETYYSSTHVGCRVAAGSWTKNFGARLPDGGYAGVRKKTGQVCVQVLENGLAVGGAPCESIHP
jgi:hypothetical protein